MNELDRMSLMKGKKSIDDSKNASEPRQRITCRINTKGSGDDAGGDRRVFLSSDRNRGTGRRRLDGGRLSFPARGPGQDGRFNNSRDSGNFNSDRRRKSEATLHDDDEGPVDPNKPQLKLVDPEFVPRGRGYFDHDNREKNVWHGKDLYDPRRDNGFRNDRRYDRDRGQDHGTTWRGFDRPSSGSHSFNRRTSAADGVWTHDKFFELEGGGEEQENKDKQDGKAKDDVTNDSNPQKTNTGATRRRSRSRSRSHSRSRSQSRERYGYRRPAEDDRRGMNRSRGFDRKRRSPPLRNNDRRY